MDSRRLRVVVEVSRKGRAVLAGLVGVTAVQALRVVPSAPVALPQLRIPGHRLPLAGHLLGLFTQRVYTFGSGRGKISSGGPLAHRAFGVWITPLSVT
jgi:hypothetical protein